MTWVAMWIFASFQSTNSPFIQILPVPGEDITAPHATILAEWRIRRSGQLVKFVELLALAAERAAVRARVEGLPAVPAEARLRRFARLEPGVDFLGAFGLG